jgi:hypothetical protein
MGCCKPLTTLDSLNMHGSFSGIESVKIGDMKQDKIISEIEICEEQAGRPNTAQQRGDQSAARKSTKIAQSSTPKSIVHEWLSLQKRMIDALTPKPLDAIELGGNFDTPPTLEDSEIPDSSDIANLFDLHATAECDLELADLDKTIRYNAVWRIICSGEARPDGVLPIKLRQLGLLEG